MDPGIVIKKNPRIVARKSGSEYILVPITDNVANMEAVYAMNDTAALVWDNIDGMKSLDEIATLISERYETDKETALADVMELAEDLKKHKIISI